MSNAFVIVGLTGPTGAGKGEVARFLRENGLFHVDTDRLSREAVLPGSDCLQALVQEFSADILRADGTLNRAALAKKAFVDPEQTARLNAIVHPAVIALSQQEWEAARQNGYPAAVIDAPLLFESGMDRFCDLTACVIAPAELRLIRILSRDKLTKEQALQRMNAQPDEAYYTSRADIIIRNDGTLPQLHEQCARLLTEIRKKAGDV